MITPAAAAAWPMHQRRPASRGNSNVTTSGNNNNNSSNNDNMYGRGGGGYNDIEGGQRPRGRGGLSSSDANSNILEQQNNERINELSDHVARLKGLSLEIGNEVREQNSLLDNMSDGFQNTRDLLQGSLMRIGTMLESGGAMHMCYMVGFSVFVLIFLWWLMSYKGTSGA